MDIKTLFEGILRDYQITAVQETLNILQDYPGQNPVIVMPTGSGKSWVIAAFCMIVQNMFPSSRVLVVTHTKELVLQDFDKFDKIYKKFGWTENPAGIYCASLGRKDKSCRITFGSVQSIYRHPEYFNPCDLLIVDEAHRINMDKGAVQYRNLINALKQEKPNMITIGLTATPFRQKQGLLTNGDKVLFGKEKDKEQEDNEKKKNRIALFDGMFQPVSIGEVIEKGYLAPINSQPMEDIAKVSDFKIDLSNVKTRNGDYVESKLSEIYNVDNINESIASLSKRFMKEYDCHHGMFFCCGVDHAEALASMLNRYGIKTDTITGEMTSEDRDSVIQQFKNGELDALTSVNVLTTGFDFPLIDYIALCRPTKSANLYVQMVGRGMRPKIDESGNKLRDDCILADFGGCIARFGEIAQLDEEYLKERRSKDEEAPTKKCPNCGEECPLSVKQCPCCGYEFESQPKEIQLTTQASTDKDVMENSFTKQFNFGFGNENELRKNTTETWMPARWEWKANISKSKQIPQLVLTAFSKTTGKELSKSVTMYFSFCSDNAYARESAAKKFNTILNGWIENPQFIGMNDFYNEPDALSDLTAIAEELNQYEIPDEITVRYNKKGFPSMTVRCF